MCKDFFDTPQNIVQEIIQDFKATNEPFTAYDISKELHERLRYRNIRNDIHKELSNESDVSSKISDRDGNEVIEYYMENDEDQSYDGDLTSINTMCYPTFHGSIPSHKKYIHTDSGPKTITSTSTILKLNKSNRICVPKKFMDNINSGIYTQMKRSSNGTIKIGNNIQGKQFKVDKAGYLALRKKHLTANEYKLSVDLANSQIILTPES
jgi:hypothetical protein